jgi:hypothetical protein
MDLTNQSKKSVLALSVATVSGRVDCSGVYRAKRVNGRGDCYRAEA